MVPVRLGISFLEASSMTTKPHLRNLWRVLVGSAAVVAVGVTTPAGAGEPARATAVEASRPVRRAAPEAAAGGISREERIAQQEVLRAALAAELPDGVMRTPILIGLTDQDREDLAEPYGANGPAPLRIGVVKALTPRIEISRGDGFDQGVLRETADGGFVWAASVSSPEAMAIRVHLTNFSLPPNAELFFYDLTGQAHGPYTGQGRNGNGDFWTHSIGSNTGVIQLRYNGRVTKVDRAAISFVISEVAHIHDRSQLTLGDGGVASHDTWPCADNASCLVDANCVSGTPADVAKDAVAKMEWITTPFVNTCSGGLLADTDGSSQIPYFLTANHCFSSSISNLETWFNYTTSSCNGECPHNILTGGAPPSDTVGITVVASNSVSDFTLGILGGAPPAGAVFLGWNNSPVAFTDGLQLWRISNANFGPQVYSQQEVDTGSPVCSGLPRGNIIYSDTNTGGTMGGSSGSPVINSAGEVVGQLYGCCGFNCADDCASAPTNWTIDGAFAVTFPFVEEFLDPAGGCSTNGECDDGNECTRDVCNAGSCENTAVADNTSCNGGAGICCGGTCSTAACSGSGDCDDGDLCTTDTCNNAGTCSASCSNDPVSCPPGEACNPSNGNCEPQVCNNNGTCDSGEDCNNCPADCISGGGGSPSCGDGTCNGAEDCLSCPGDCNGKQNGNPSTRFCCNADGGGAGEGAVDCSDSRCNAQGFSCGGTTDPYCCGDLFCEGAEDVCNCAIDCGSPGAEICGNGADDDCDGQADCNDADCDGDPACECGGNKAPCSQNSDCCSNNCRNGECKGN
jgi:hypothetical protein